MKSILKNKRGEGYIDVVVEVLISMMLIVLALNTFSFLAVKQDLDHYAKEMITVVCVEGKLSGTEVTNRKNELTNETGLTPSISYAATYFNASNRTVQLGDTITVTLTYRTTFKGFGVFNIPITLTAKHSGLSQRYWK